MRVTHRGRSMRLILKSYKKLGLISSLLVLLFLFTACSSSSTSGTKEKEEAKVVHVGVQAGIFPLVYAKEKQFFEKAFEEVGVEVKWHEFASGPPHFEAMASNRLDFGVMGGTPVIAGQSGGIDFQVIAASSDAKNTYSILLPKGSDIKELKDLKGKKIAIAKGSNFHYVFAEALKSIGLTEADVDIVQLQPDEARAAFDTGAIDAWPIGEPTAAIAIEQTGATVLTTAAELGLTAPILSIARTGFTEKNPELTVLFLETYQDVIIYMKENLDEVSQELADLRKLDKEVMKDILERSDFNLSPITEEFQKSQQEQADFLLEEGIIKKELDTSEIVENKFIDHVLEGN